MANPTSLQYAEMLHRMTRNKKREVPDGISEPVKKESTLHNQIIEECRSRGWQYLHGAMSERTHRTLGEPDFVVLAGCGHVYFIECKAKGGKLSPAQQAFKHHSEKNGHRVYVVYSFAEFLDVVNIGL